MQFLKLHARKILTVTLITSATMSAVFTYLLFNATRIPQAKPKNELLAKAQNYLEVNPEKTSYNILLLGFGGEGHSGGGLSDTLLIANVDTKSKVVNLIAIPRDIWIGLPVRSDKKEFHKINMAYAAGNDDAGFPLKEPLYKGQHGGGNMAMAATREVTGLTIDNYAAIDFGRFEKAIDALEGIDVNVPVSFNDYFYPIKGLENDICGFSPEKMEEVHRLYKGFELEKQFTCRYEHLQFNKGITHMDGKTALKFIRSRHSNEHGGDFARGQRQQAVLTAIKNKLLSLDVLDNIDEFYSEFINLVNTDLVEEKTLEILSRVGNPSEYSLKEINITTDNYLHNATSSDGQYILVPKAGIGDWSEVQEFIKKELK